MKNWIMPLFVLGLLCLAGCPARNGDQPGSAEDRVPDDPKAVAALEKLGCALKKDAAGSVIIVDGNDSQISE